MFLAIETSCDETAAAVVEKNGESTRVLSNIVSSQVTLHAPFGGVVPNLAAREHVNTIIPVTTSALRMANIIKDDIEAIAVTAGPGLMPALQIGVAHAKTLAYLWKKPLLGIHHIEGHIYANFILNNSSAIHFPLLALVVSGGHTELVFMRDDFDYDILGTTEDDAVGEAFDKVAKMLSLPYPGGPEIARRAQIHSEKTCQFNQETIAFPRPMIHSNNYQFSFSGLKTSVLYFLKKNEGKKNDEHFINAVCAEFQNAAIDVLIEKTRRAIFEHKPKSVIIAGGVSANVELRVRMQEMIEKKFPNTMFHAPAFVYSLDNASMIGTAACFRWEHMTDNERKNAFNGWMTVEANPNLVLT